MDDTLYRDFRGLLQRFHNRLWSALVESQIYDEAHAILAVNDVVDASVSIVTTDIDDVDKSVSIMVAAVVRPSSELIDIHITGVDGDSAEE